MDKKQICDLWNEEIRNDAEYNDSFKGLEVTLEEETPIRWAPFSKDMQETADRLNIQVAIVHKAYDRSRVRYYKIKYPETYDK